MGQQIDMASFAHDIRNMLSPALLSVEHLASDGTGCDVRHLERIHRSIEKTVALCQHTLSCACETRNDTRGAVSLQDTLRSASRLAVIEPRDGISISVVTPSEDEVLLDGAMLYRIAFNLVRNASTALTRQDHGFIDIIADASDGILTLIVEDDGPGLPEPVLVWLKRYLATGTPTTPPPGLGLVSTAHLAKSLGGSLELRSSSHHGTKFEVRLPYAPVSVAA